MNGLSPDHRLFEVAASTPHRYPMLLIDGFEVDGHSPRSSAWKMISANESHQEGAGDHDSGELPSTLLVDSMGQLAIAMLGGEDAREQPEHWLLASIESMQFSAAARCGDRLRLEAEVLRSWQGTSRVRVRAEIEDREIAQGVMVLSAKKSGRAEAPVRRLFSDS